MNVGIQQGAIDQLGEPLHKEYMFQAGAYCCQLVYVYRLMMPVNRLADCRRKAGVPTKASVSPMCPNS
ncbi:hypothetical protein [Bacillus subtilis]|uniref:hypothetical protein n=1 Tax=Bacillus subtilis TaxID=1423 RepID=UPI00196B724E